MRPHNSIGRVADFFELSSAVLCAIIGGMEKDYKSLKKRATYLRRRHGRSYGEIQKELHVSKSTISLWLRNIPLSEKHRQRLYTKQVEILSRGPQSQRERRKREISAMLENAQHEISLPLSRTTFRLIGAFLYWGEGSKTSGFEVTNSDPYLIAFFVRWVKQVFGISPHALKARMNIYPQQNEAQLKQFWSQLTDIPIDNFGKTFVKPANKGYKKNNLYYGTIKVRVPKATDMRHRVFGWLKKVLSDIEPEVVIVQREWKSLRGTPRPVNLKENLFAPR
jgi:hypothetical protein